MRVKTSETIKIYFYLLVVVGLPLFLIWMLLWGPCWMVTCNRPSWTPDRCFPYCQQIWDETKESDDGGM